jgi:hypothetical protein
MALLLSSLSFFSVRNQSLPFVDACHYSLEDGQVFCEVKYTFDALVGSGLSGSTHLYDWVKRWRSNLVKSHVPESMMLMGSRVPGELGEHVFESHALVGLLSALCVSRSTKPPLKCTCFRYLESLVQFTLGTPAAYRAEVVGEPRVRILQNGLVEGWASLLRTQVFSPALLSVWQDMCTTEFWGRQASSSVECARLPDVLQFCLVGSTQLRDDGPALDWIAITLQKLIGWLGIGFRAYLCSVYAGTAAVVEGLRSLPSQAPRTLQVDPGNNRHAST